MWYYPRHRPRIPGGLLCHSESAARRSSCSLYDFENLTKLAVPDPDTVVKVGDTIADIQEGVHAKVWSVGVVLGSNEMALTEEETHALPAAELENRIAEVKQRMLAAGASYVIRSIEELPALIQLINSKLNH